jgi:5-hydroxyisourate hydrolase
MHKNGPVGKKWALRIEADAIVSLTGETTEQQMAGRLTTHVLDTMHGKPARGLRLELLYVHGDHTHHILDSYTNADGRVDQPLLEDDQFQLGEFEIHFHVGQYFERLGVELQTPFLNVVPVRFTISEDSHYHVPLLVSPFGYSTYRGS